MENFIETFRQAMKLWDSFTEKDERVQKMLDDNQLIFFFKKNGEIYGASEDGRMSFACINDDEEPESVKREVRVHAMNLSKSFSGEKAEVMFDRDAMSDITVLDRDEIESILHKSKKKKKK